MAASPSRGQAAEQSGSELRGPRPGTTPFQEQSGNPILEKFWYSLPTYLEIFFKAFEIERL